MYEPKTIDILADALVLLKDIKPALTDKNVDNFISGVAEAREVLKGKQEVDKRLQQAIEIEASNEIIQKDNIEMAKALAKREDAVNARELAVKGVEADNAKNAEINAQNAKKNEVKAAELEAAQAVLTVKQETVKADLEAAAAAKKKAEARLAALNNVPAEE